ncbi:HAD family hydrolase [Candidatus Woesearchaeota archaeon]|nr:HAD family hydrolase [Candidatus Woesearchaeota archaeon]
MRAKLLFDLDETLVSTAHLQPYFTTNEGKEYIANNIDQIPTELKHPELLKLVRSYHKNESAIILTNSPPAYARNLLNKHGFPADLPVYAALNKPHLPLLERMLREENINLEEAIFVGDSAIDILSAHAIDIASTAVTWGNTSTEEQLKRAEPQKIVSDYQDLEKAISDFENRAYSYQPRLDPDNYLQVDNRINQQDEVELNILDLGKYIPYSRGNSDQFSKEIMRFKKCKNHLLREIKANSRDKFFYNGQVRDGSTFISALTHFLKLAAPHLEKRIFPADTCLIPLPNSLPEYCYKTDINLLFTRDLAKLTGKKVINERIAYRLEPVQEAHLGGSRSEERHYRSSGFLNLEKINGASQIVLFDDITTSGSQLKAFARMLRFCGFKGKISAMVLGKTTA